MSTQSFPIRIYLIGLIYLFFTNVVKAQKQEPKLKIDVGKNVQVNLETPGVQFVEPHIAAHPSNPDHLLAVGWPVPTKGEKFDSLGCISFLSTNGGLTWSAEKLSDHGGCADPWVTLTEKEAIITTIASNNLLPDPDHQLLVYFSANGNNKWFEIPQSLGLGCDGPRSIADQQGIIYITSGKDKGDVFVARVLPGTNFAEQIQLITPNNLWQVADGTAILSDGTLVISYQDYQRPADRKKFGKYAGRLKTRRVWAMVSNNYGKSFSAPKLITEASHGRPSSLAADLSNRFKDRLYNISIGEDFKSLNLSYSTDAGEQWSEPFLIEPATQKEKEVRLAPQIAVNKEGIVAVAWIDNRDDPLSNCYTPYIAFSTNGGETFNHITRVGSELSCPDPKIAGEYVATSKRWSSGGDYFGITTSSDGKFHLLWPDARSGKHELFTAAITVKTSN